MIQWTAFNWEAFATLISGLMTLAGGLLAVFAAWKVGARQLDIIDRQVRIDEVRLRSELFDRRLKAIDAINAYAWIVASQRAFISTKMSEEYDNFTTSVAQIPYLFDEYVEEEMKRIENCIGHLRRLSNEEADTRRIEERRADVETTRAYLIELLMALPNVIGDELRLTTRKPRTRRYTPPEISL